MSTTSKTKRAPRDWRAGFRLADDPSFDTERQLTLFEHARNDKRNGKTNSKGTPNHDRDPKPRPR